MNHKEYIDGIMDLILVVSAVFMHILIIRYYVRQYRNKEEQQKYDVNAIYEEIKQFIKDMVLNIRLIKNDLVIEKDKLSMSCVKYDRLLLITVYNIGNKVLKVEVINDSIIEKDVVTKLLSVDGRSDKLEDKLKYVLEYINKDINTGWWFENES